jgi:hypothetical protein
LDQLHQRTGFFDGDAGRRLVEQEHTWLGREHNRKFELALVSMGQLAYRRIGPVEQSDKFERFQRAKGGSVAGFRHGDEVETPTDLGLGGKTSVLDD